MVKKALLLILGIALSTALVATGCQPAATPTLDEAVPQRANVIASAMIHDILTDPDLIQAYDDADKDPDMPQTVDEAMAEIEDGIGIDPRDFSHALVFADAQSDEDYWGAIVTGTFDQAALLQGIEAATGQEMTSSDYHGRQLYTDEYDESGLCFLAQDRFIIGTVQAVRDAIDVDAGYEPQLAGPIVESYAAMGEAWVIVATATPAEWAEEATQDDDSLSTRLLEGIDSVGASLSKAGDSVTVKARLRFKSPLLAGLFVWTAWNAKTFMPILADIPPEAESTLARLQLGLRDSLGMLSLTSTVDELEELIYAMQEADW